MRAAKARLTLCLLVSSADSLEPEQNCLTLMVKIVSEYDQEIPQSQTADNPMAPRGRAAQKPEIIFEKVEKLKSLKKKSTDDKNTDEAISLMCLFD